MNLLLSFCLLFVSLIQADSNKILAENHTYKLYIFEGSDWCTNCLRLERQVLSTTTFEKTLGTHAVALEKVDFPQRKKLSKRLISRNDSLATIYEFDGTFPTLVISRVDTLRFAKIQYSNQSASELSEEIITKTKMLYD